MRQFWGLLPLAFGAVVINTMPMWLAELAGAAQVSDTLAGAMGSSVLLAAAMSCAFRLPYLTTGVARIAVPCAFAVMAADAALSPAILAVTCLALGLALGALTRHALGRISADDVLQGVSMAFAAGLCVSVLAYLAVPILRVSPLWVLAVLSLALFADRREDQGANSLTGLQMSALPIGYLPFFALMGAYWSFIEIYARSLRGDSSVAHWLLGSLVASAAASTLAARLPPRSRHTIGRFALCATALSGAVSYWVAAPLLLGLSIVANGFFLFLYFPLYLSSHGDRAPLAMALYLFGFAFGGVMGAAIIAMGGYTTLGLAILLSPVAVWIGRPSPAAG